MLSRTTTGCAAAALLFAVAGPAYALPPFDPAAGFPRTLEQATGLMAGDVDGDGLRDLVAASYGSGRPVVLMRARPDGTFDPGVEIGETDSLTYTVRIGDVTGDGRADVVLGGNGGAALLRAVGDGTFAGVADLGVPTRDDVELADVDGDADLDLVGADGGDFVIGRNDGTGTFTSTSQPVDDLSAPVALGDFDGDGDTDAVAAADDLLRMLRNDGGTFVASATVDPFPHSGSAYAGTLGAGPMDAAAGDDVVVGEGGGTDMAVVSGSPTGLGSVLPAAGLGAGTADHPDIALGDLDLDGDRDVLLTSYYDHAVSIVLNDGAGGLTQGERRSQQGPEAPVIEDLDRDGAADIAFADYDDELVHVEHSALSVLEVPPAALSITEGQVASLTFRRTASTRRAQGFELAVEAGSAAADDLAPVSKVTFAAGQSTVDVPIGAVADGDAGPQTLVLRPTAPDAGLALRGGATTVTITDPPAVTPPTVIGSSGPGATRLIERRLRQRTLSHRAVRRSGLPVTFRCRAACQASTTVRLRGRTYGLRSITRRSAGTTRTNLRLTLRARTALRAGLRRMRSVNVTLVTIADGTRTTRRIVVRR